MDVILYSNTSDYRVVDKSLRELGIISNVKLLEPCTVEHPTLTLILSDIDVIVSLNYFYIPDFKRYYTISDDGVIMLEGGLVKISGNVDVLMTYKEEIRALYTYIERNEYLYSPYLQDRNLPARVNRIQDSKIIGVLPTSTSGRCIALTVNSK